MSRLLVKSWNPDVLIGAVAQTATIAITFPVWQVRQSPPNLPLWRDESWSLFGLEPLALNFGWPLLASVALAIFWPIRGALVHLGLLLIAVAFDQFRLQPQFLCIALLMLFTACEKSHAYGRWLLVALWFWAGLHKWLSPEWFGFIGESLLSQVTWLPPDHHFLFALAVAASEMALGVIAVFKPSVAAILGPALHLSIVAFLSPLGISKNVSVVPWNLYIAWTAAKLFHDSRPLIARPIGQPLGAAILLITPIGFYTGHVDRTLSFVLYSGNLPQAMTTHFVSSASPPDKTEGLSFEQIDGWGNLAVPFPRNHVSLIRYFEKTAANGSKLHIQDPRPRVNDRFFVMTEAGPQEIDVETFLRPQAGSPPGRPIDSRLAIQALDAVGCRLLRRDPGSAIYAVQFDPQRFRPASIRWLPSLLAIEQVQFAQCPVTDKDLVPLRRLPLLSGLGLSHTQVTDAALDTLKDLPHLEILQVDGTAITSETLNKLGLADDRPID